MNFKQAYEKLQEVADGKYNTLYYEVSTYQNGERNYACWLYVNGFNFVSGDTWKEAFKNLYIEIGFSTKPVRSIDDCEL